MKKIFLILLNMACCCVLAQNVNDIPSYRFNMSDIINSKTPLIQLSNLDMPKINQEDNEDILNNVPPRFGYREEVNISVENSGEWMQLTNGDRIWSLKIKGNDILSINLLFDYLWIPKGGELYIYNLLCI